MYISHLIKVIDQRGLTIAGTYSIYGNQYYDLAKLYHSVIGLYDYIIAGRYYYQQTSSYNFNISFDINQNVKNVEQVFVAKLTSQFEYDKLKRLVVLLFLSMLPLHSDRPDRQQAMLANAYRLYNLVI